MGRQARSVERARQEDETHGDALAPESVAIMGDVINAIKATPTHDLRSLFEQVVARRAGVLRVRLRPAMTGAADANGGDSDVVTVTWRGARFVLDAGPHTRDRAHVAHVLQSAVAVAAAVLRAQGIGKETDPAPVHAPLLDDPVERLVGSSPAMGRLRDEISASASNNFSVLIEGESGVGKELVARQIHVCSARRRGPFVPVNCAAVVESLFESELFGIEDGIATGVRGRRGKFEQANGGTLFLDEIAELPLPAQAKLLRVVQDFAIERVGSLMPRRVDVRLIVATNRSLCALVDQGLFRRDLYFRLRSILIRVAPLRDRPEDIVEIADAYLHRCDPMHPRRLSGVAASVLGLHHWPGNVRELERALEYAITRCNGDHEILVEHLATDLGQPQRDMLLPPGNHDETLQSMKSRYARLKFDQYRGNKRKTCAALDISYHTLVSLLKRGVKAGRPLALPRLSGPGLEPESR